MNTKIVTPTDVLTTLARLENVNAPETENSRPRNNVVHMFPELDVVDQVVSPEWEPEGEIAQKACEALITVKNLHENECLTPVEIIKNYSHEVLDYLTAGFLDERKHSDLEKVGEFFEDIYLKEDLNWIPIERAVEVENWRERDDNRRVDEWLAERPTIKNTEFFIRAKIPMLKINIDTYWGYDKEKRRPVRECPDGLWNNWTRARVFIINQIIKKNLDRNEVKEEIGQSNLVNITNKQRNQLLKVILEKHDVDLDQSLTLFAPNGTAKESPTLIFCVKRKRTQPTRYSRSIEARDEVMGQRFKHFVKTECGGAHDERPMTYFELEEQVIRGNLDEWDEVELIAEPNQDEKENDTPSYDFDTMPLGLHGYVSWCASNERHDLAAEALGEHYENSGLRTLNQSTIIMNADVADAVWEGRIHPSDCHELWGNFWKTIDGQLRKGLWLYNALDYLETSYNDVVDLERIIRLETKKLSEYSEIIQNNPDDTTSYIKKIKRKWAMTNSSLKMNNGFYTLAVNRECLQNPKLTMAEELKLRSEIKVTQQQMVIAKADELSYRFDEKAVFDGWTQEQIDDEIETAKLNKKGKK